MNSKPFKQLRWAAMLLIVVLLAACADGCSPARDANESLLNRSPGGEPESLDIHKSASTAAARILRDLGEGLVGYSASGELEPGAAERWEVSADGMEYRFWLRPDARWSNGDPVIAEHFEFALKRLVDPKTAAVYSQSVSEVENAGAILAGEKPVEAVGVSAPADLELIIRLNQPVPYFLSLLTHPSMFPLHPGSLAEHGDAYARPGNHLTNGAYKLDDWQVSAFIELSRNEHYRDNENTAIDRVRYLFTPESMVEMHRYRAGELDITDNVPPEAFQDMRSKRPGELRVAPYLNVYYYGYNLTRAPFNDNPQLRRALSMAIDREALTGSVIGRGEQPAYSLVPPGVINYEPPQASFASLNKDEREAKARQLYRDAGYSKENPLEVEIRYNTSDTHRRIALAVHSMWRTVLGVEAQLVNEDFQVLLENMRARQVTEVFRSSWSGDYNDAHSFLQILQTDNPSNFTGYSSDEFDSLMRQAEQQTNPNSRQLYLEEAEKTILRDNPVIPLYFYVSKHMVSPRVQGWQDNVLDYHYSRHLSLSRE